MEEGIGLGRQVWLYSCCLIFISICKDSFDTILHCLKFFYNETLFKIILLMKGTYCCCVMTLWTVACQAPLSMGFLQVRILESVAMPSSRVSSQPKNQIQVSCIAGGFFTVLTTREAQECWSG